MYSFVRACSFARVRVCVCVRVCTCTNLYVLRRVVDIRPMHYYPFKKNTKRWCVVCKYLYSRLFVVVRRVVRYAVPSTDLSLPSPPSSLPPPPRPPLPLPYRLFFILFLLLNRGRPSPLIIRGRSPLRVLSYCTTIFRFALSSDAYDGSRWKGWRGGRMERMRGRGRECRRDGMEGGKGWLGGGWYLSRGMEKEEDGGKEEEDQGRRWGDGKKNQEEEEVAWGGGRGEGGGEKENGDGIGKERRSNS